MRYPAYRWIDVAIGGAQNRNKLTDIRRFRHPGPDVADCYRTVYRYPDAFADHMKQFRSVRGYRGPAYADFFPIDIDAAGDLAKSKQWAEEALEILGAKYDLDFRYVRIYFSGSKGFHLMIPDVLFGWEPSVELPDVLKRMAQTMFDGKIALDPVIYDRTRLFRLSNTKHGKTGLYKVPLTAAELFGFSPEEIVELAKQPREVEAGEEPDQNPYLAEFYTETLASLVTAKQSVAVSGFAANGELPKDQKLCYLRLCQGVGEGLRNEAGLRLATHWRKMGFDEHMARALMYAWNARNNPPLPEKELESLIRQGYDSEYDYGCWDSILDSFCDQRCYLWRAKQKLPKDDERVSAAKIYSMSEAAQKYIEYAKKVEKLLIKTGFRKLDSAIRGIAPGEVMEVMARSGVGKTAWLINVLRYVATNQRVPVMFFSLEQPLVQIWERSAQMASFKRGAEIEQIMRSESEDAAWIIQKVADQFPGVYVVDEDFLTIEEIEKFIMIATEQKIGQKPGLVAIDYLGRMHSTQGRSPYEITSYLAKTMKNLAKRLDIPIIYLHQTSRAGRDGSEEITLDMGRDSGVTEEAADFVLALWRPEMQNPAIASQKREEILKARLLKNRKGKLGDIELIFDKETLWIGDEGIKRLSQMA